MPTSYQFLPWVRRGLTVALDNLDNMGALPAHATAQVGVKLAGVPPSLTVTVSPGMADVGANRKKRAARPLSGAAAATSAASETSRASRLAMVDSLAERPRSQFGSRHPRRIERPPLLQSAAALVAKGAAP